MGVCGILDWLVGDVLCRHKRNVVLTSLGVVSSARGYQWGNNGLVDDVLCRHASELSP